MSEAGVSASLYEAHLCDAGCGDYLDIDESQYWQEGWFYCESSGCLDEKSIGSIPLKELQKDFKYCEGRSVELEKDSKWEYWGNYTSKVRRSCRLLEIDTPEWAKAY